MQVSFLSHMTFTHFDTLVHTSTEVLYWLINKRQLVYVLCLRFAIQKLFWEILLVARPMPAYYFYY